MLHACPSLRKRLRSTLLADILRRVAIHIALADERTLPFLKTYLSQGARSFSVARAVIRSCGDTLSQEVGNRVLVCRACVVGVSEASLNRKRDLVEPFKDMQALS